MSATSCAEGVLEPVDDVGPLADVAFVEPQQNRFDDRQVLPRAGRDDAVGPLVDRELHPHQPAGADAADLLLVAWSSLTPNSVRSIVDEGRPRRRFRA